VLEGFFVVKHTGRFDNILDAHFCPRKVLELFLGHDAFYFVTVNHEHIVFFQCGIAFFGRNFRLHAAVDGIKFELIREILRIGGNIHDCHHIDFAFPQ